MKSLFLLLLCWVTLAFRAPAQSFRYSEEVRQEFYPDGMQFVANVGGNHHLLLFRSNDKPWLCIFNSQLRKLSDHRIDTKLKANSLVRIVPFGDDYLFYSHTPGEPGHYLWRIDREGNQTPLSAELQKLVQTELANTTGAVELMKRDGQLFLVSHSYFDSQKSVVTRVVQVDQKFNPVKTRKVVFAFDDQREKIQQIEMEDDHLLVLKTTRDEMNSSLLNLQKIGLDSNDMVERTFSAGSSFFSNAAFSYTPADSTVLVHSMVRNLSPSLQRQTAFFMCRLNHVLEEETPVRTMPLKFSAEIPEEFLWIDGLKPHWLGLKIFIRFRNTGMNRFQPGYLPDASTNIRLTAFSGSLTKIQDSLLNEKNSSLLFVPYANTTFRLKGEAYLLLTQKFPRNNKGLLLFSATKSGLFHSMELPVYSKNDYQLAQLQPVNDHSFIIPYRNKRDIGLVRISLSEGND